MADLRRAPPLYAELPLPAILRPKSTHGELNRALLTLPDPLPTQIRSRRHAAAAALGAARARRRLPLLQPARRYRAP